MMVKKAAGALADGHLLASEKSAEVVRAVPTIVNIQKKADQEKAAQHHLLRRRLSGASAPTALLCVTAPSCLENVQNLSESR
jgi:hypothetical protein